MKMLYNEKGNERLRIVITMVVCILRGTHSLLTFQRAIIPTRMPMMSSSEGTLTPNSFQKRSHPIARLPNSSSWEG